MDEEPVRFRLFREQFDKNLRKFRRKYGPKKRKRNKVHPVNPPTPTDSTSSSVVIINYNVNTNNNKLVQDGISRLGKYYHVRGGQESDEDMQDLLKEDQRRHSRKISKVDESVHYEQEEEEEEEREPAVDLKKVKKFYRKPGSPLNVAKIKDVRSRRARGVRFKEQEIVSINFDDDDNDDDINWSDIEESVLKPYFYKAKPKVSISKVEKSKMEYFTSKFMKHSDISEFDKDRKQSYALDAHAEELKEQRRPIYKQDSPSETSLKSKPKKRVTLNLDPNTIKNAFKELLKSSESDDDVVESKKQDAGTYASDKEITSDDDLFSLKQEKPKLPLFFKNKHKTDDVEKGIKDEPKVKATSTNTPKGKTKQKIIKVFSDEYVEKIVKPFKNIEDQRVAHKLYAQDNKSFIDTPEETFSCVPKIKTCKNYFKTCIKRDNLSGTFNFDQDETIFYRHDDAAFASPTRTSSDMSQDRRESTTNVETKKKKMSWVELDKVLKMWKARYVDKSYVDDNIDSLSHIHDVEKDGDKIRSDSSDDVVD